MSFVVSPPVHPVIAAIDADNRACDEIIAAEARLLEVEAELRAVRLRYARAQVAFNTAFRALRDIVEALPDDELQAILSANAARERALQAPAGLFDDD